MQFGGLDGGFIPVLLSLIFYLLIPKTKPFIFVPHLPLQKKYARVKKPALS